MILIKHHVDELSITHLHCRMSQCDRDRRWHRMPAESERAARPIPGCNLASYCGISCLLTPTWSGCCCDWSSSGFKWAPSQIKLSPFFDTQRTNKCLALQIFLSKHTTSLSKSWCYKRHCSTDKHLGQRLFACQYYLYLSYHQYSCWLLCDKVTGPLGGTLLTITGRGFGDEDSLATVLVDGRSCLVRAISNDRIVCQSPAFPAEINCSIQVYYQIQWAARTAFDVRRLTFHTHAAHEP